MSLSRGQQGHVDEVRTRKFCVRRFVAHYAEVIARHDWESRYCFVLGNWAMKVQCFGLSRKFKMCVGPAQP